MFHIALHFIVPVFVVAVFFRKDWRFAYLILVATIMVDIDHLLAEPIYDPKRCSIGFHPLHGIFPILFYSLLCFVPRPLYIRLTGLGLMIHMALDSIDCQVTNGIWIN